MIRTPFLSAALAVVAATGCVDDESPTTDTTATAVAAEPPSPPPYQGSSFAAVWQQVVSDPYQTLPEEKVTVDSFYSLVANHLLIAAKRTISDRSDLLPWYRKLIHPNGICLAGTWTINEETPYTGYYRKGSKGLVILRASTGTSEIRREQHRVFGVAAKLFPTLDPGEVVETANLTLTEDLGGRRRDHFLDALNTNDIRAIGPNGVHHFGALLAQGHAFSTAENTLYVPQALFRQVYSVGEAGEVDRAKARSPKWLQITGAPDVKRVVADDFRDELRVARYPGGLRFQISAADEGATLAWAKWKAIGTIVITADAASDSCDHRLHFPHLPFRK